MFIARTVITSVNVTRWIRFLKQRIFNDTHNQMQTGFKNFNPYDVTFNHSCNKHDSSITNGYNFD